MNVVTVTRDFGAGGYEVARRLAELLGWELLDRELLHQAATLEHLPDAELERLDEKAGSLLDRLRQHPPHERYLHGLTEAAHQAAARGNVVLVGRGTAELLAEHPGALHLRLVAPLQWRAERMAWREGRTVEEALARCVEQDRGRERFTRYFFGASAFQPARYDLMFNTARVPLDNVAGCVAFLLEGTAEAPIGPGARVLTLSRELGAGDDRFAAALAGRLGLKVCDRELLEQEAIRLGVSEAEVEKMAVQPTGAFRWFRSGGLHQRYFEVMKEIMTDRARQGNVLLVGRGGSGFLRDHAGAFHLRMVADLQARIRHVMERHWCREGVARQLIDDSDNRRRRFFESHFAADWANPLEYHLTINGPRLGPVAVDAVALVAENQGAERGPRLERDRP